MASLMRDGLMVAVRTDATVFRAFVRSFNLLDPPELITSDPEVVNRVLAAYQTRDERPAEPALGPDRAGLLAELGLGPEPSSPTGFRSVRTAFGRCWWQRATVPRGVGGRLVRSGPRPLLRFAP